MFCFLLLAFSFLPNQRHHCAHINPYDRNKRARVCLGKGFVRSPFGPSMEFCVFFQTFRPERDPQQTRSKLTEQPCADFNQLSWVWTLNTPLRPPPPQQFGSSVSTVVACTRCWCCGFLWSEILAFSAGPRVENSRTRADCFAVNRVGFVACGAKVSFRFCDPPRSTQVWFVMCC